MVERNSLVFVLLRELAWFVLPVAVFLLVYCVLYHAPLAVVAPHLARLIPLYLGLQGARLLLGLILPWQRLAKAISAALVWFFLVTMVLYYSLVLISISAWGRVISWPLIAAYANQAGYLMEILALPKTPLIMVGTLFLLGCYWLTYRLVQSHQSLAILAKKASPLLAFSGSIALLVFAFLMTFAFVQKPSGGEFEEPIALTFFYEKFSKDLQSHSMQASSQLNHAEDLARKAYPKEDASDKPNVILIVVDALRARQLSMYGYARQSTPNLQRLVDEKRMQKIDAVHSVCAESACGLMGIASSRYVHQFIEKPFLLSEALKRNGYSSHLILGGDHTSFYNLKAAYDATDSYFDAGMSVESYRNDDKTVLKYLEGFPKADKRPAFLQFHLMSVHALGTRHPEFALYQPVENYYRDFTKMLRKEALGVVPARSNYYDNGVVQADAMIEALLQLLRDKGYLEKALVVITADHGESLGEHQIYGHVEGVYENMLNIPLLFYRMGYQEKSPGVVRPGPISQIDIAPSIMHDLGLAIPQSWQGTPVQNNLPSSKQYLFFEQKHDIGLIDWRSESELYKFWFNTQSQKESVFDLKRDPEETNNIQQAANGALKAQWFNLLAPLRAKAVELKKVE